MKPNKGKPPPRPKPGPQGLQPGAPMGDNGEIFFSNEVAARIAASEAGWVRLNFRLGPNFSDWTSTSNLRFSALSRYDIINEADLEDVNVKMENYKKKQLRKPKSKKK